MRLTPATLVAAAILAGAPAHAATIAGISAEDKPAAIQIRLAVDPAAAGVAPKVVCSPDAIRVRLPGLVSQTGEVARIDLPPGGPFSVARIVPRDRQGSVVQLVAAGSNMAACQRTSAMDVGGEIIISTELTEAEIARRDLVRAMIAVDSEKPLEPEAKQPRKAPEAAPTRDAEAPPEPKTAAAEASGAGAMALFGGGKGSSDNQRSAAPITSADDNDRYLRYAAGLALVVVLGVVAWRLRRRRGKAGGPLHDIDILSTRRIGPKQQLLLVSVEGAKVLLAVSDRTINTLNLPQTKEEPLDHRLLDPDVGTHRPSRRADRDDYVMEEDGFGAALKSAVGRARRKAGGEGEYLPDNVNGLMALARNRAVVERAVRKDVVQEA